MVQETVREAQSVHAAVQTTMIATPTDAIVHAEWSSPTKVKNAAQTTDGAAMLVDPAVQTVDRTATLFDTAAQTIHSADVVLPEAIGSSANTAMTQSKEVDDVLEDAQDIQVQADDFVQEPGCLQLQFTIHRVHGLLPAADPGREVYVQLKVGSITKQGNTQLCDSPASCGETIVLPMLDSCITFSIISRKGSECLYDTLGECEQDIASLDDSSWTKELSVILEGKPPQGTLIIDYSFVFDTPALVLMSDRNNMQPVHGDHHDVPLWRLIDAKEFVLRGVLKVHQVPSLDSEPFIAISYRWTSAVTDWRAQIVRYGDAYGRRFSYEERLVLGSEILSVKGLGSLVDDASIIEGQRFFTQVALNVLISDKRYFWMDILCIDQDAKHEKEYFVPRMGLLYKAASSTHAYPTGTSFLTTLATDDVYFPVWETRAWTLQEQINSRSVTFCYPFEGNMTDEISQLYSTSSDETCTRLDPWSLKGRMVTQADAVVTSQMTVYLWRSTDHITTCVLKQESSSPYSPGGLPTSAFLELSIARGGPGSWNNHERAIGRTTLYKTIFTLRHTPSPLKKLRVSLALHGGRQATVPADMIYSLLGVLDMEDFPVSYDFLPADALLEQEARQAGMPGMLEDVQRAAATHLAAHARLTLFEAMPPHTLASVLGIDWGRVVSSDKDSALPRIVDMVTVPGITMEEPLTVTDAHYSRDTGLSICTRSERFRIWKDLGRRQSRNLAVMRALQGRKNLMIMFVLSLLDHPELADCPVSSVPEADIRAVVLEGSTVELTEEEYLNPDSVYDTTMVFVEIGSCSHNLLFADGEDMEINFKTALLGFNCTPSSSGQTDLVNRGTVLIFDASKCSGDIASHVIQ